MENPPKIQEWNVRLPGIRKKYLPDTVPLNTGVPPRMYFRLSMVLLVVAINGLENLLLLN